MRSKLNYLINFSFKKKVKTKSFVIVNIILAILVIGALNIDSIINAFGGDFSEKTKIYVVDNTDIAFDTFKGQTEVANTAFLGEGADNYDFELYEGEDDIKELINGEKKHIAIIFNFSDSTYINASIVSDGYIDTLEYQIIATSLNNTKLALVTANTKIPAEELNKILSPIEIERVILDEAKKTEDETMEMVMGVVFPVITLPFFMLSLFLVQMIGAEVNDEKTTRGMEIIISNVSPKTHFFAKVIAGNLFVILQGLLLATFSAIGFIVRGLTGGDKIANGLGEEISGILDTILKSGIGDKLVYIIPIALILMLLTFLGYSLLSGILASMTTSIEDFQQLQTPIMIISLIGYYLAIMAGMFEGSTFIKVVSCVPFISAILAPTLLVLGQIGIGHILVSIILIIITNYLLIKYGLKIYKVGILNYSSKDLWKKMFKAIRS